MKADRRSLRRVQQVGWHDDFKGLRLLRDRLDADFVSGIVLHCGERTDSFGDRLLALPVSALWAP
jgi:uncharacterized protein